MEYVQMTLTDWVSMKRELERELNNLKTGFVRVGYVLRKIEETKAYRQDGYSGIAEFARAEYNLSASTVSRFMAVNERFSLGGYSERLDPQYLGFGQSIMSEMLGLPDSDLPLVTKEMSRQDVRELKAFNREAPEAGIADDIRQLIEEFFRENRKQLDEICRTGAWSDGERLREILNPSGNRVFRKGLFMMFFYREDVKIKKFGADPQTHTWEELGSLVSEVFREAAAGGEAWNSLYGEGEKNGCNAPDTDPAGGTDKNPGKRDDAGGKAGADSAPAGGNPEMGILPDGAGEGTVPPSGSGDAGDGEGKAGAGSAPDAPAADHGAEEGADKSREGGDQEGGSLQGRPADGQSGSPETSYPWDGPGTEKAGAEGLAPAQKLAETASEIIPAKYREGDCVTISGRIERVRRTLKGTNAEKWFYSIRTQAGNEIWADEEDIAIEAAT